MSRNAGSSYVPELDGLRAIAVLAVMIYHAVPQWLPGGFLGVEVFFVLSGFLITSLLLAEYRRFGAIDLKCFYMRRVLRLTPALVLMLIGMTLSTAALRGSIAAVRTAQDAGWCMSYCMNWLRAFGLKTDGILLHCWSLAIEEQFYLCWPILLLTLISSTSSIKRMGLITLSFAGLAVVYRTILLIGGASMDRLYNGLDTRADGLLLGCAVAMLLASRDWNLSTLRAQAFLKSLVAPACGVLGGLMLTMAHFDASPYLWGLPVVSVATVILVLGILSLEQHWLRSLLGRQTLVWIGQRSYGLYLWHYPIDRLLRSAEIPPIVVIPIAFILSFVVAACSFHWFEKPILKLKDRFKPHATTKTAPLLIGHFRF